jgi:hypothetical protein
MIVGASDFQSAFEPLSLAHLKLDQNMLKVMGRPFDFTAMAPAPLLPEVFDPARYLTVASVVNTLYSAFGVPSSHYRTLDRAGKAAPVLGALLR